MHSNSRDVITAAAMSVFMANIKDIGEKGAEVGKMLRGMSLLQTQSHVVAFLKLTEIIIFWEVILVLLSAVILVIRFIAEALRAASPGWQP